MSLPSTKLTYHDYLQLPEDGKRYEIMDGELYMTPAPATRHQTIVTRLTQLFMNYLDSHTIGRVFVAPTDVLLSQNDVVEPDVLVVLDAGRAKITEKNIQGPPDLVIETLSPSTAARDCDLKRKRYEHFSVREYWLVNPDVNSIEVLRLTDSKFVRSELLTSPAQYGSPLLPGLLVDLT